MRELKQRVKRIENKTGLDKAGKVIKVVYAPHTCGRNKARGEIYSGGEQIIIGDAEKQECNTCEYKNICSQKKPERFKMLWEKHFKSDLCNTCTEAKFKENCGFLDIQKARL